MDYVIGKDELFQKLERMDKSNLDRVGGFIECLFAQRAFIQDDTKKRKPLLVIRNQDE